jgi:hypothetical protein
MVPPPDLDRLSHAERGNWSSGSLETVVEQQRTIAARGDEIARLKGGPRRPDIGSNTSGIEAFPSDCDKC